MKGYIIWRKAEWIDKLGDQKFRSFHICPQCGTPVYQVDMVLENHLILAYFCVRCDYEVYTEGKGWSGAWPQIVTKITA